MISCLAPYTQDTVFILKDCHIYFYSEVRRYIHGHINIQKQCYDVNVYSYIVYW